MLQILVVDDDRTVRRAVTDTLREAGHTVESASGGVEALKTLSERAFDLVLTDVRMPGVDGLELFRAVRTSAPSTDVILMTAYGEVEDAVHVLKEGASDYLTKPFAMDELVVRVERLEEQRRLRSEILLTREQLRQVLAEASRVPLRPRLVVVEDVPPEVGVVELVEQLQVAVDETLLLREPSALEHVPDLADPRERTAVVVGEIGKVSV